MSIDPSESLSEETDTELVIGLVAAIGTERGLKMSGNEFREKLNEASKIVNDWPNWKKRVLSDSFKSRNTHAREPVDLNTEKSINLDDPATRSK